MKLKRSENKNKLSDDIKKETTSAGHKNDLLNSVQTQSPEVNLTSDMWKVLLVDDEPDVHEITRIGLKGFTFDGKTLDLISAYSAKEAREILQKDPDFSVALIDVVMETEEAGLDLVHFIRKELGLSHIRIIIRTGQPGKAPERFVINNFDIDDYKDKTDLTTQKMHTMFISSVKAYRDILIVERIKNELDQKVQDRTHQLQEANKKLEKSVTDLQKALGQVKQLSGLLPICSYCKKIRDDKGYWSQIECYIQSHSEAEFSHGICQECLEKHYPDEAFDEDN